MMGSFQASVSHLRTFTSCATEFPGAVYTGLAVNEAHTMLYAANDKAGTIDVFNSSFDQIDLGDHAFRTPGQIEARGLVPFNVTDIGGHVYVTYAPAGREAQTMADEGDGAVAIFSESGKLEPHGVLLGGPHTPSPLRGASLSLRTISASSAATFWWAISASCTAKSTLSISRPTSWKARSRSPPVQETRRAVSGP